MEKLRDDTIVLGRDKICRTCGNVESIAKYLQATLQVLEFYDYVKIQTFRENLWKVKEIKKLLENAGIVENEKREIIYVDMKECPKCKEACPLSWNKHMYCGTDFGKKKLKKAKKEAIVVELEKIPELRRYVKE